MLVGRHFGQLVKATPRLWHHVIVRPQQDAEHIRLLNFRLVQAACAPLHLCIELFPVGDLLAFVPLFRERQEQWQSIVVLGTELSSLEPLLEDTRLSSLHTLRLFTCSADGKRDVSMFGGLKRIFTPNLRQLRAHIIQFLLVDTNPITRLQLECYMSSLSLPQPLAPALSSPHLTHVQLDDVGWGIVIPDAPVKMPSLTTFVLKNVHADNVESFVQSMLLSIDAPHLRNLAISIDARSSIGRFRSERQALPLHYPALKMVLLNQTEQSIHSPVAIEMLYSLGWAFPLVEILQTNIHWSYLPSVLDPNDGLPCHGHVSPPLPVPFPRIKTLALRDSSVRSLQALESLLSTRGQTTFPISQCGVESHLLHIIQAPDCTKVIAWDMDLDSDGEPWFPIF